MNRCDINKELYDEMDSDEISGGWVNVEDKYLFSKI
jgi:hypothetical protein